MSGNWYKIIMKILGVKYGKGLRLKGTPLIYNCKGAKMQIGSSVTVNSSFLSNLVGLYSRSIILTRQKGAVITIGDNVGISGATLYARNSITVGDNTMIGGNCKILDNDFHPTDIAERNALMSEKAASAPITIGKNCFIGCNVIILKGAQLGDGCIVGAGSVVTGKFPDGSVIAGNPARIIKRQEETK